jgi:hypothetical protein
MPTQLNCVSHDVGNWLFYAPERNGGQILLSNC